MPILYYLETDDTIKNPVPRNAVADGFVECLSCRVSEELNGEYTADVKVSPTYKEKHMLEIGKLLLIKTPNSSDMQFFRIYKKSLSKDSITLHCNHVSYDLNLMPCYGVSHPAKTMTAYMEQILNGGVEMMDEHISGNFTAHTNIGGDMPGDSELSIAPQTQRGALAFGNESLLQIARDRALINMDEGEFEWDNNVVHLYQRRGADRNARIINGANAVNMTLERAIENVPNFLTYYAQVNINKANMLVTSTRIDSTLIQRLGPYRYAMIDVGDNIKVTSTDTYSTVRTKVDDAAQRYYNAYIGSNTNRYDSVTVEMADVEKIYGNIYLADTVELIYPRYEYKEKLKVVAYEYDAIKERYISLTLGSKKPYFSTSIERVAYAKSISGALKKIK